MNAWRSLGLWVTVGGVWIVLTWLMIQCGLFIIGIILSRFTLTIIRRAPPEKPLRVRRAERWLLYIYWLLLEVATLYHPIHLIIQVAILMVIIIILLYVYLISQSLYLLLMFLLSILGGFGLFFLLIFSNWRERADVPPPLTPPPDANWEHPLTRHAAPRLWEEVEAVAARMGTRPVESIIIVPDTGIGVNEKGTFQQRYRGAGQRVLVIGLGSLVGMSQAQFQAILAHEYAHLNHHDLAWSQRAMLLRERISHTVKGILASGMKCRTDPLCLFANGYDYIYLRISLGASRLQEILADRSAALAYGVTTLTEALRHTLRQELLFQWRLFEMIEAQPCAVQPCAVQPCAVRNLYTLPQPTGHAAYLLGVRTEKRLAEPTSPYDSHPSYNVRVALLRDLPTPDAIQGSAAPVWDLFPDPGALQEMMTALLLDTLTHSRNHPA